jgi:hypothetical protein
MNIRIYYNRLITYERNILKLENMHMDDLLDRNKYKSFVVGKQIIYQNKGPDIQLFWLKAGTSITT